MFGRLIIRRLCPVIIVKPTPPSPSPSPLSSSVPFHYSRSRSYFIIIESYSIAKDSVPLIQTCVYYMWPLVTCSPFLSFLFFSFFFYFRLHSIVTIFFLLLVYSLIWTSIEIESSLYMYYYYTRMLWNVQLLSYKIVEWAANLFDCLRPWCLVAIVAYYWHAAEQRVWKTFQT